MYIERIYTGCLAEAAYYIESDGLAAVIDPMTASLPEAGGGTPVVRKQPIPQKSLDFPLRSFYNRDCRK